MVWRSVCPVDKLRGLQVWPQGRKGLTGKRPAYRHRMRYYGTVRPQLREIRDNSARHWNIRALCNATFHNSHYARSDLSEETMISRAWRIVTFMLRCIQDIMSSAIHSHAALHLGIYSSRYGRVSGVVSGYRGGLGGSAHPHTRGHERGVPPSDIKSQNRAKAKESLMLIENYRLSVPLGSGAPVLASARERQLRIALEQKAASAMFHAAFLPEVDKSRTSAVSGPVSMNQE